MALKTFANQALLPRLPVPALSETLERYLASVRPVFAAHPEYAVGFDAYARSVADFGREGGLGHDLQRRLIAHDKTQPSSWLESWWLRLAYLSWREPLLVNSNWFLLAAPHPNTPRVLDANSTLRPLDGEYTDFQLIRAAGFISNLVTYKDMVDNEAIKPEKTRAGPLCMNQYRYIFGISRIPKPDCDVLVGTHPSPYHHIIVIVRDQIHVVYVYQPGSNGGIKNRVGIADILAQLRAIVADLGPVKQTVPSDQGGFGTSGKSDTSACKMQPAIGVLTGTHRDNWTKWRAHLESIGNGVANKDTFKWIDTALFAVSLDNKAIPGTTESQAKATFHGFDGTNRWFDKCHDIVFTNDGRVGANGEHSPCDALVPAIAFEFAARNEPAKDPPTGHVPLDPSYIKPRRLSWTVDDQIHQAVKDGREFVAKMIADSDLTVIHFTEYGGDFIKKIAKISPDAYIQMCLQLTFYRMHQTFASVYETASTRKYLHGRTETCRSLSLDSQAFIRAMESSEATDTDKYKCLEKASKSHVSYLTAASDGRGVDRHLLGLRMVMTQTESADIFKHPVFTESSRWRLSTSGLFPSDSLYGTGFGAVYPDGYGMNYTIQDRSIKIGIESKISCAETSTPRFGETFKQVLRDVKRVCESVFAANQTKL